MKLLGALLSTCITTPIWYYLLYKILVLVSATELMWFLFWIYVPVGIFSHILFKVAEGKR